MDRPVREKKPTKHYDPAKEAAKPQWKKPKKPKVNVLVGVVFIGPRPPSTCAPCYVLVRCVCVCVLP